jgi:hypothetical protein
MYIWWYIYYNNHMYYSICIRIISIYIYIYAL